MSWLLEIDRNLLLLINKAWTHPALDWFFPIWTDFHKTDFFKFIFVPALILTVLWRLGFKGAAFLFFLILGLGINDGFCGTFVKHFFERARPGDAGLDVIVRAPFGGFSFPSNHAANMFFVALFVSIYFPKLRWPLFIMAFLTAYSRMYCGVHYPSDVIGGALIGLATAALMALCFRPIWGKIQTQQKVRET